MIRGARTTRRELRFMIASAVSKCACARSTSGRQTFGSARSADHLRRIVAGDAGMQQAFARQIQPAEAGVLVDVAQDVGQLQRAAEMMREQDAVVLRQAEHPHRQPSDRAGDAVAIQIERRQIRRADVLRHVHLHAVDDGEEILALETEPFRPTPRNPAVAPADGPDTARRYRRAIAAAPPAARAADRRNRRCRRPAGRSCRSGTSPRAVRAARCASRHRTNCRTRWCRNLRWPPPSRASCAGRRL